MRLQLKISRILLNNVIIPASRKSHGKGVGSYIERNFKLKYSNLTL